MSVYRGNIPTCDALDPVYKYLVEDQGRIADAGANTVVPGVS